MAKIEKPYTLEQAAELAGCSARTLRRAIQAGRLVAYQPGASVVIQPDDFRLWLQSTRIRPVTKPKQRAGIHHPAGKQASV